MRTMRRLDQPFKTGFQVRDRLVWAVGILVFLLGTTIVLFGSQTYFDRNQFRNDFHKLLYHQRVITLALKLLSDAKDLETGQRGFLLTDNSSYLEPYQNSRKTIIAHLDMLLSVSRKSPSILAEAQKTGGLIAREISILNRAIVTQEVSGQKTALKIITDGEPKARMDALRISVGNILLIQNREITILESIAFKDRRIIRRNFLLFLGSSFLFILITIVIIYQEIRKNSKLLKRLEEESSHDELTGIPNRRFLQEWSKVEILQDRNKEFSFTLLYLDLNHFKAVNDQLGHAAGDHVLKAAVKRFQSALREGDLLVRIGGDEFIAIIRGTLSPMEKELLVQRLRRTLLHPSIIPGNVSIPFGLSVGIASYPDDGDHLDDLLRAADKDMYQDKMSQKTGRSTKMDSV